jgi:selenocysteine lyase/cysteine desulfurase
MTNPLFGRRALLAGGALVVAGSGAAALAGCTAESQAGDPGPASGPTPGGDDWGAVRAQFALDPDLAHFAAYVLAAHPQPVRDAIDRWRNALDANTAAVVHDEVANDEAVRAAAARYLRVAAGDIALTDSTTMGLGLVYHGLPLDNGSHVLTTTHDFYSAHESLRLAAARAGAEVEKITLYDDPAEASADEMVARVAAAIRAETRVVALTWVHSSTGVKIPVRLIADVLSEANEGREPDRQALLCLDAIHGLGAEQDGPVDLGCDVFISGTHKWLFGPRGTGLVWASPQAGEAVAPIIPSFQAPSFGNWLTDGDAPSPFGLGCTPGGYQAFEHRWAAAEAFEFHQSIGIDRVAGRTRELATRLKEGLSAVPGVRVVTPLDPELSSGLVCCDVVGRNPGEVVERLQADHGIVASVTPYRDQYTRFGASIVTTPQQVDDAVTAIEALAS